MGQKEVEAAGECLNMLFPALDPTKMRERASRKRLEIAYGPGDSSRVRYWYAVFDEVEAARERQRKRGSQCYERYR